MLWVDKYRPNTLDQLTHHAHLTECLKKLAGAKEQFPHLLFYGPSGAGKKTRINCMLREKFGAGAEKLRIEHKSFSIPSRSEKLELITLASPHHLELTPSDAGYYDRLVVQEVIKEIAQTRSIDFDETSYKVLVLNDVDKLSKSAQHALRRTMEKYMRTCRLILCCKSTSKVIDALQSRCLSIRVAAPSDQEVASVLQTVCAKQNLQIPEELALRVAASCEGNLRRAVLQLEAMKVKQYPFTANQPVEQPDWQLFISERIAKGILEDQSPNRLLVIRGFLYELLAHCVPEDEILKQLLVHLLPKLDESLKQQTVHWAAHYEHRIHLGSKSIFHLEAFVARFMALYKAFLVQLSSGF